MITNRRRMTVRAKLFLLASFLLAGAAVLVGMVGEWLGQEAGGPTGPVAVLAVATFGSALALGIAFAKRSNAGRGERSDPPLSPDDDGRPVLVLIWWPIVIIAIGVAILMATVAVLHRVGEGSGLPIGICLAVGVFGFISLPNVIIESLIQFRGRGIRGFWRGFRQTEWGDGGPG